MKIFKKNKKEATNFRNIYFNEIKFFIQKMKQLRRNSYRPALHSYKKNLTIIACHTNSKEKLKIIFNNFPYFHFKNNDIIIINTSECSYKKEIVDFLGNNVTKYFDIPNDKYSDVGKWMHVLNNFDYSSYDNVVFTNDSFLITDSIRHFYNLMTKSNEELYAYNDSSQICYHYQSYLFSLKQNSVARFIEHFNITKDLIHNYDDLVFNIELKIIDLFSHSHNCFLKIANFESHQGLNIFFSNDKLYTKLLKLGLLPFVKLKRL